MTAFGPNRGVLYGPNGSIFSNTMLGFLSNFQLEPKGSFRVTIQIWKPI